METLVFLRWIGGKSKIIHKLGQFVPAYFERYWEPFLGGASMFFFLKPHFSFLSDSNGELINCYIAARDYPDELSKQLEKHKINHSKEYYYQIRKEYNLGGTKIDQSARFIYLNKACFNGIYRVNRQGEFNVPYGEKINPSIPDNELLRAASYVLRNADLKIRSYDQIINLDTAENDFIYLDPPYPPLNGTSYFSHYTQERFLFKDQEKLSETANELNKKKCKVMITNADTPIIRQLYKNWKIISIPVIRWVSANGVRYKVNELVIINYETKE
jgi:DNA adenine methylase